MPARLPRFLTPALLLAAALCLAPAAQTDPTTKAIDAVLNRPLVSGLAAASSTPRIAWVENRRGVRNLATAAAPGFEPRQLTAYSADDGQPLSGLTLTPDGSLVVFSRGSGPNAAGETANPSSAPTGAEQALWVVPTDASAPPWKIAQAGGAVIQPPGDRVLFSRGSQVFEVPLVRPTDEDGEPTEPEAKLLFSARGGIGDLTPSPDGRLVAFVSDRGDHSFVGVYNRQTNEIAWMAPSVDRDTNPVFAKNGTVIAFLRTPGTRAGQRFDITAATPFSLWTGNPRSGFARHIWSLPENAGGFAQFYPPQPLDFAYNGEYLVFLSEHEGWLHLYRVALWDGHDPDNLPADDGAIDLTPGSFEVESFTVARDETTIYIWGNFDDRNRRHIYSLNVETGGLKRLGSGDGIEVEPLPLANGQVAYRSADARTPMRVAVMNGDGSAPRIVAPDGWPDTFPIDDLVVPEAVTFEAADGLEIHGVLFAPTEPMPTQGYPAVIYLHGGPIRQMLLGWHYSDYYAHAYAFNQFLARRGYVVLAVNFRSGIGYGQAFRRAENQGPRGAAEYQDVVAGGRYLAARDDVDGRRIGLWGGSYGGLLTAQGLARNSDLFAAGVDLHGVHDWAFRGTDFPLPGGAWGLVEDDLALARESSPVAAVDSWRSPVLFVHGDDDRNVLFQQTTDLVQRLRERDVHIETLILPDEVHGFLRHESWLRTFAAAFTFFEYFLEAPNP